MDAGLGVRYSSSPQGSPRLTVPSLPASIRWWFGWCGRNRRFISAIAVHLENEVGNAGDRGLVSWESAAGGRPPSLLPRPRSSRTRPGRAGAAGPSSSSVSFGNCPLLPTLKAPLSRNAHPKLMSFQAAPVALLIPKLTVTFLPASAALCRHTYLKLGRHTVSLRGGPDDLGGGPSSRPSHAGISEKEPRSSACPVSPFVRGRQ